MGLGAAASFGHDDGKGISHSAPVGIDGTGPFESSGPVQFLSQLTVAEMGGTNLNNDIWGWTDSQTGREYALVGQYNGTAFVDVTDPAAPVFVGRLPTALSSTVWRDVKVYNDHAYIVADGQSHGLQIFDLTTLRDTTPGTVFSPTPGDPDAPGNDYVFHHDSFGKAHNVAINEQTGFAYIVGSNRESGGLHVLDLSNPIKPTVAGTGFSADGYTHDTQVVTYQGPDAAYAGNEIAFSSNEDTLTIVDVTSKTSPAQLSRAGYAPNERYSHQGWLSEDHQFFYMNDELDEPNPAPTTRTHIWDVRDLDNPAYLGFYSAAVTSKDHNLYVRDGLIFAANYASGLRVLDPTLDPATGTPSLSEIGYLDTYASDDDATFNGAWSVYPFFDSGTIVVNDRQNGLFVARLLRGDADGDGDVDNSDMLTAIGNFTGPDQPLAGRRFEDGSFDGDGDVDNTDMLTAIGNFTGPGTAALSAEGESPAAITFAEAGSLTDRPNHTNLLYDPLTGNLKIDPTEGPGSVLTGYVLNSDGEFLFANHQTHLGGTETSLAGELSEANSNSTVMATIDLGDVLPGGLSLTDLEMLLTTANYTGESGTGVHELDLVVVPEPKSIVLLAIALLLAAAAGRRRIARWWKRPGGNAA